MSSYSSLDQHQGPGNKFLQILPPRFREPKKLKAEFDRWTSQQPIPLEALISGLAGTVQGGAMGFLMGSLVRPDSPGLGQAAAKAGQDPDMLKTMQAQMGGPWVQARNFAVITGVHAGIAAACRRIRKKDDTYTTMIAGFGSGAAYSVVSGITQGNPFQAAFTTGVLFAAFQGALHKLSTKFSAPKKDPTDFMMAKTLLTNLGFPEYSKNIQKGRLDDRTMWLWNDVALRDVRIPPGPRLLILNHVSKYREELKPPPMPIRPLPPQEDESRSWKA